MNMDTTPLEPGLDFFIKFDKVTQRKSWKISRESFSTPLAQEILSLMFVSRRFIRLLFSGQ